MARLPNTAFPLCLFFMMISNCASDPVPIQVQQHKNQLLHIKQQRTMHPIVLEYAMEITIDLRQVADCGLTTLKKIEKILKTPALCGEDCKKTLGGLIPQVHQAAYTLKSMLGAERKIKRDAFWPAAGRFLSSFAGTLDQDDGHIITTEIFNLRSQQKELVKQLTLSKTFSLEAFQHLESTIETVNNISSRTEAMLRDQQFQINQTARELTIISTLQAATYQFVEAIDGCELMLLTQKINGRALPFEALDDLFQNLEKQLDNDIEFPWLNIFELTAQSQTAIKIEKSSLKAKFNIPAIRDVDWKLTEIDSIPIVESNVIRWLDLTEKVAATLANISTVVNTNLCLIDHEGDLICKLNNPINWKRERASCVENIAITGKWHEKSCRKHLREAKVMSPFVIRDDVNNNLLILTPTPFHFAANCSNWQFEATLKTSVEIKTTSTCEITVGEQKFYEVPIKAAEKMVTLNLTSVDSLPEINTNGNFPTLPRISEHELATMKDLHEKLKMLKEMPTETKWVEVFSSGNIIRDLAIGGTVITILLLSCALYCYCKCKP